MRAAASCLVRRAKSAKRRAQSARRSLSRRARAATRRVGVSCTQPERRSEITKRSRGMLDAGTALQMPTELSTMMNIQRFVASLSLLGIACSDAGSNDPAAESLEAPARVEVRIPPDAGDGVSTEPNTGENETLDTDSRATCASSNQCNEGSYCTTEDGDCLATCPDGEMCATGCMGYCQPVSQRLCSGSHQCPTGTYCTTEDGDCSKTSCKEDICPALCGGVCRPR